MAFKSYHTMNGQIIGESGPEGTVDYQLDGLGSVIGTWRTTGTLQNQYRYSGYGQLVHKSGTGADPYFLWVGGWGYRTRGMVYVRRRTFYEKAAVWTSVDPLWPWESAYRYAFANPIRAIDRLGLKPHFLPGCDSRGTELQSCCDKLSRLGPIELAQVIACMARDKGGDSVPPPVTRELLGAILKFCRGEGPGQRVCVRCQEPGGSIPHWPPKCANPCPGNQWGEAFPPLLGSFIPAPAGIMEACQLKPFDNPCPESLFDESRKPCACSIVMCNLAWYTYSPQYPNEKQSICAIFFHEIAHCGGYGHIKSLPDNGMGRQLDAIYKIGCCVCRSLDGPNKCKEECTRQ